MTRSKVMVADSGISARQMKDFWRKVDDGSIDGFRFQGFLRKPDMVAPDTTTLTRAIKILGAQKVVSSAQAMDVWSTANEHKPIQYVNFDESMLDSCARSNGTTLWDWRLVYVHGFSLSEQERFIRGTGTNWWLENMKDAKWAERKHQSGYRLLNFMLPFGRKLGDKEGDDLCGDLASEAIVAEAVISIYYAHGDQLLADKYHRSGSLDKHGGHVTVGAFDTETIDVHIIREINGGFDDCVTVVEMPEYNTRLELSE